ncbi:MAG: hypothetical protein KY462_11560 [Actinobacteria bacterium]|nr:hypothetical protein [Actinomycetota bacterium]
MAAPRKSAGKKTAAQKATAQKATAKKATAKKAATKRAPAKKAAKKSAAKQPSVRSAAAKARGAAEDISVVVTSRVKQTLNNLDMRMDSELAHEVNRRVQNMLSQAAERARSNKRSTVRPHDL